MKPLLTCLILLSASNSVGDALASHESQHSVADICKSAIGHYRAGDFEKAVMMLKDGIGHEKAQAHPSPEHLLSLYRNLSVVYRGFDHRSESEHYDALAQELESKIRMPVRSAVEEQKKSPDSELLRGKFQPLLGAAPFRPLLGAGEQQTLLDARKKDAEPERLAQYNRVQELMNSDEPEEASKEAEKGLEKFPGDQYFVLVQGKCKDRQRCKQNGNGGKNISQHQQQQQPQMSPALKNFVTNYVNLGKKYNETVNAFEKSADDLSTPNIPNDMPNQASELSRNLGDLMREMGGCGGSSGE